MRTLLTAILLAASLPAAAGELREPVMDLLNAYESTATPDQLAALGEGVAEELMAIADDGEVANSRRGRELTALGYFPGDETRAFLEARLADEDASSLLRRKAAYALGEGWGEAAVSPLGAALADDDVQLRIAAAGSLAKISGDAAEQALKSRLAVEDSDAAREAIEKALQGR